MKISKAIAELQQLQSAEGDVELLHADLTPVTSFVAAHGPMTHTYTEPRPGTFGLIHTARPHGHRVIVSDN